MGLLTEIEKGASIRDMAVLIKTHFALVVFVKLQCLITDGIQFNKIGGGLTAGGLTFKVPIVTNIKFLPTIFIRC